MASTAADVQAAPEDAALRAPADYILLTDDFSDSRGSGKVIGSRGREGAERRGVDREGVLGIDNGALRIRQMLRPGWGRCGIAYGPYPRRNGLAFAALLLNGHNASQVLRLPETLRMRMWRWALGAETERPRKRLLRWLASRRQNRYSARQFLQWWRSGSRFIRHQPLDENLAVGWFPAEAPRNPLTEGESLIVHAVDPECGEVWARSGAGCLPALRSVQNVPMFYVVILREQGAAYYAASVAGVPGTGEYPSLRPLAIDAFGADPEVYAGIHQSVLGQIGFRTESRVYRAQVAALPQYERWYGSAHGADALRGRGPLHLSAAEQGGAWRVVEGSFTRTEDGLVSDRPESSARLALDSPAGLLHVIAHTGDGEVERVALLWRMKDEENHWSFEAGSRGCRLGFRQAGVWNELQASAEVRLLPNTANSIQIADDGGNIKVYVNGSVACGVRLRDSRLSEGSGVGLRTVGAPGSVVLRRFEAHPRTIAAPPGLDLDFVAVPQPGSRVALRDPFAAGPGDLEGRTVEEGNATWRKEVGRGAIEVTAGGFARVVATAKNPCPGRVAYTVPWHDPGFADVQVRLTPPGTCRGKEERGRGGLIFWQDERNYITLSMFIDDSTDTFSIAAFFRVDGFEELYDAVWTNVGRRIDRGMPCELRVCFEGERFLASVNGEPLLYRALSDVYPDWRNLALNRVGIVVNWEWGTDSGTIFEDFVARDRA